MRSMARVRALDRIFAEQLGGIHRVERIEAIAEITLRAIKLGLIDLTVIGILVD